MKTTYKPISCSYYDRLEAWAVRKEVCTIVFRTPDQDADHQITGHIVDLYSKEGAEYLRTDGGEIIRLDYLKSINDIPLPGGEACVI